MKILFCILWITSVHASEIRPLIRPLIIGGVEVSEKDPIALSTVLLIGKIQRASFTCTGVILTENLILTAGHCLGGGGWADITVYFRTKVSGQGQSRKAIKQVRIRDDYPLDDYDWDDLALLRLDSPIPTGYVPAKILADANLLQDQADIILAGYGRTVPLPPASGDGGVGVLRKVEQKILQARYTSKEVLIDIAKKGSCSGDSGGPALMKVGNDLFLFGIASRMTEHDRLPDQGNQKVYGCIVDMVYSNVLAQMDWIKQASEELMH